MHQISEADVAALRNSGQFDAKWYVDQYPDVALSGMDPALHYLWIGAKLGRKMSATALSHHVSVVSPFDASLDALFVDGTNGTSSTPYRVHRVAEALIQEGWRVQCVRGDQLGAMLHGSIQARYVVFHRSPLWSPAREFADKMREQGSIIVFDIDDLIFDEDVIPYIDGYKYLPDDAKDGFLRGVRTYRDFIFYSDFCTAATSFLVDEIKKLGKPAFRVRNTISEKNIDFFSKLGISRKIRPSPFVIGYYSGTKTHQADFSVAAEAIISFMNQNDDVVFRLVGDLDLHDYPELVHWQHIHRPGDLPRVTRVGLMPHDVMMRDQANCDLIIAPLEVGNPFCEAKSELKFFEASLVKCPVVASSTQSFVEATQNGRFGYLATTTQDWLEAFREIYNNYTKARKIAANAYEYVRRDYCQNVAGREAIFHYEQFSCKTGKSLLSVENGHNLAENNNIEDVAIIIPDVTSISGGHRKIFKICEEIELLGYSVALYVYSSRPINLIRNDIVRYYYNFSGNVKYITHDVGRHNFVICTQWKTAYDFKSFSSSAKVFYFVQDFEPMFYEVGSNYLMAMESYSIDAKIICYGKWVGAKLEDDLKVKSDVIPFTLDHGNYYSYRVGDENRDIDVLFFARPSQDRRCFSLIVEGIRSLKQMHPHLKIGLFGEEDYEDLEFEYTNFGEISQLSKLADLYRRTKVGICFSTSNPSQLGYEMVACGAVLLDVKTKFCELNFGGDDFVKYCSGTPESIARSCLDLLEDEQELSRRRERGYEFTKAMPNDDELGKAFLRASGLGERTVDAEIGLPERKFG